jgi:hypothetical protein
MTVNISYRTEEFVVALTDSKISDFRRESNATTKLKAIKSGNYHGSLCGCGFADTLVGIFRRSEELNEDDLKGYLERLRGRLAFVEESRLLRVLENGRRQIEAEVDAFYYPNRDSAHSIINGVVDAMGVELSKKVMKDGGFDASKVPEELMNGLNKSQQTLFNYLVNQQYEKMINRRNAILENRLQRFEEEAHKKYGQGTRLMLDVYDKKEKMLRRFSIDKRGWDELEIPPATDGSGKDGADYYFSKELQGKNSDKFSLEELVFHVGNAYACSTINVGVGGTPNIMVTSNDGVRELSREKSSAVANVCGAYSAGILKDEHIAIDYIKNILSDKPNYENIAKSLDLCERDLTKAARDPNEWIEIANNLNSKEQSS